MSEGRTKDAAERLLLTGVRVIGAALVIACLMAATRAWFSEDDFRWLASVRAPDFSFRRVWLPLDERDWWSWRPLAMHTYFYAVQSLLGLQPVGFYVAALTVHFGRGLLVDRLARQLGFPASIAAVAGLLAVSRPPSVDVVFWASAFSYFAVSALGLLSATLFLDHLDGRGRWRGAASVVALLAALLSQESAVAVPGVLALLALLREAPAVARDPGPETVGAALGRALRATAAHWVLVALYAVYRFGVIAEFPRRGNYEAVWGANALRNAFTYVEWIAGGEVALTLALATGVAAVVAARRLRSRSEALRGWLAPTAIVLLLACLAGTLPFAPVRAIAPRFAIALEVPAVLLWAAPVALLWARWPAPTARGLAAGLLVLCALAMPWSTLHEAFDVPRGNAARHVAARLAAEHPQWRAGERIVVLYGRPGMETSAWAYHRETWNGTTMLAALEPGLGLSMAFRSPEDRAGAADVARAVDYFALDARAGLRRATGAERAAFFRSVLGADDAALAGGAAARLALELGEGAIADVAAAAGRGRAPVARALLLIDGARADAEAARHWPDAGERRALRAAMRRDWGLSPVGQKKPPPVRE